MKGRMVKNMKVRIKSFSGQKEKALDDKVNDWIKKNPAIEILEMQSNITTVSHYKVRFFITILYKFGQ